jgi:hypothetical membrane protein
MDTDARGSLKSQAGLLPAPAGRVPWYIWACFLAVTSGSAGTVWDISWHKSIGRDSFWTPAHILIYLCGVVAGLSCGFVILAATFGRDAAARETSVKMWGFRGPLGAFLCAWGGLAMIASAPFDNWWHNAYGLDVRVLSPPHIVLAFGMLAIRFGLLLFILGHLSRAEGRTKTILEALLLYSFMCLISMSVGTFQEKTLRIFMHSAQFYLVVAAAAPLWLGVIASVSGKRWACTIVGAIYTVYILAFVWILPLFPAEPKLGPVYQPVTRFVPPDFPLLLIVPAFAFDLLRRKGAAWSKWALAAAGGAVFVLVFAAVQWPFANFLQSTASHNWFFATQYIPYFIPSSSPYVRYVFVPLEQSTSEFWLKMGLALAIAAAMTRLGLGWGSGMRKLRR